MRMLFRWVVAALCLFPVFAFAESVTTTIGTFMAPDGVAVLDRDEKPDPKTGKPVGLIVFSKANDSPRAVFIVTWTYVESSDRPFDALDSAVKIGNPFDRSLTRDSAKAVAVGGIEGGRYEGILPNGLRAISYVAANGPYRLIILLKGPASSPYKQLADDFARGLEGFVWKLPEEAISKASK